MIEDLTFVRVIHPKAFSLIPRHLFEQVKDFGVGPNRVDEIYSYGFSIMTTPIVYNGTVQYVPNLLVYIAVIIDENHIIKGFVWADINILEKCIFVQVFSIDKEYQSLKSELWQKVADHLFAIPDMPEYKQFEIRKKICLATTRPKAFEKAGEKISKKVIRSKRVLMECNYE